jgi:hypothetical protein
LALQRTPGRLAYGANEALRVLGRRRKETRVDFLNGDTVQHLIGHYGYGAIFVIVMLESAGIADQTDCRSDRRPPC